MTEQDVNNSITLIGPSSVGKSFLSDELSKKLKLNIVSVDDLLFMIEYERDGWFDPEKDEQDVFIRNCAKEIMNTPKLKQYMKDPILKEKIVDIVLNLVGIYKNYVKMFGSLKCFYEMVENYQQRMLYSGCPLERTVNLSLVSMQIVEYTKKVIHAPIIFDMPAPFGWSATDTKLLSQYENGEFKHYTNVEIQDVYKQIENFLNSSTTVLLTPGLDYNDRNTARDSAENNLLLEHIKDYYDNAKIMITTNALFNEPKSQYLKNRSWLDAQAVLKREELKNKGVISNICDEILDRINELKEVEISQ